MDSTFLKNFLVNIMIILGVWAFQAMSYTLHEATVFEKHEQWMAHYGRVYSNKTEKERRFRIFKENVEYINKFNSAGNHTYKLGINEFADLTSQEFLASHTGYNGMSTQSSSSGTSFRYKNVSAVPPDMDWRESGAVTPVKNQDKCGCCWAFSAVAAMEGLTKIRTGQLISLSEQEIIDCDGAANGCVSGYMTKAFEFAISKGVTTEANYPYTAVEGTCNTEKAASPASMIKGYEKVPINDEQALLTAVANQPVSVAVDSSRLHFYKSGILTGECGVALNHAITAVGYGTSKDGIKFWLFKNSWGTSWGENGYVRMQRDIDAKEGMCGIAMQASYPTA